MPVVNQLKPLSHFDVDPDPLIDFDKVKEMGTFLTFVITSTTATSNLNPVKSLSLYKIFNDTAPVLGMNKNNTLEESLARLNEYSFDPYNGPYYFPYASVSGRSTVSWKEFCEPTEIGE